MNTFRFHVVVMIVSSVAFAYFLAWSAGVTPASSLEREFMTQLQAAPDYARHPKVAAALAVAEEAPYFSRRHFLALEAAFWVADTALAKRQD